VPSSSSVSEDIILCDFSRLHHQITGPLTSTRRYAVPYWHSDEKIQTDSLLIHQKPPHLKLSPHQICWLRFFIAPSPPMSREKMTAFYYLDNHLELRMNYYCLTDKTPKVQLHKITGVFFRSTKQPHYIHKALCVDFPSLTQSSECIVLTIQTSFREYCRFRYFHCNAIMV